ncbi:MAG TPA: trypsin-like serine protease [Kofleriaceae bacterium]|jgi:hypothetical protein
MSQVWRRTFAGVLCGAAVSVAMAATGCGTDETESEIRATEGTEVTLPPLPYGTKGDRESDVVIGSDGRSFTPWAYPYSTVAQSEIGCTATMVGRMVAVMAAHCVQYSTGSLTFGRGFNGSHTGESLLTIGWHWWAWGQSSFNPYNSTNDWAILIMDSDPNMGWLGSAWVPLPTDPGSAAAYPWISGWSTGYGAHQDVYDNLNRFKRGSVSQTGGGRYPNWIASYDIEPGDSGSSFVRDSDGRVITIQSAEVGADGCSYDNVNCVNLVSPSAAWWNSYIAALNAHP